MNISRRDFILLSTLFVLGCEKKDKEIIHWDRDMCVRCKMVVSDRKNTVKLQLANSSKYFVFDDIGCYVWWIEKNKNIKEKYVIINDSQTGEWIDMRKALYTSGNLSPMGYGFWAYKKGTEPKDKKMLTYEEVKKLIIKRGR